jgi:hypothetical protein
MNRRSFLKGLVAVGAGLILPVEPDKRFWALDQTMIPAESHNDVFKRWLDVLDPRDTPFLRHLHEIEMRTAVQFEQQLFQPATTTIHVDRPELFSLNDPWILIDDELMAITSFNSDGSIQVQRNYK